MLSFERTDEEHFADELWSYLFSIFTEPQTLNEKWRKFDKTKRPHNALGYCPPAAKAIIAMDQTPIMH
jgi:hypothetical protein